MADFIPFDCFVADIGLKVHNLNTDTIKLMLTNSVPNRAAHTVKTDLTEITNENGYAPADIQNTWSQADGVATLAGVTVTWIGTGGSFGPFRYIVAYNDTAPAKNLISFWDYGASIQINNSGEFTTGLTILATIRQAA